MAEVVDMAKLGGMKVHDFKTFAVDTMEGGERPYLGEKQRKKFQNIPLNLFASH